MDIPVFENLTCSYISRWLYSQSNIQAIETLLYDKGHRLGALQELEKDGKLDFGEMVDINSFGRWYNLVSSDAELFLGLQKRNSPLVMLDETFPARPRSAFGHSRPDRNDYDPGYEAIRVGMDRVSVLVPKLAHEDTHHMINQLELKTDSNLEAEEGICRGVARYISNSYAERFDNVCFRYHSLDLDVGELRSSYLYLLGKLGMQPDPCLLLPAAVSDRLEKRFRTKWRMPTPHSIGNTYFQLLEEHWGTSIYKECLGGLSNMEPDITLIAEDGTIQTSS